MKCSVRNHRSALAGLLFAVAAAGLSLVPVSASDDHHHDDSGSPEALSVERGPHGGRLLRDDDLALEIGIFERGTPPELRVYATRGERAVDLAAGDVTVSLERLGREPETLPLEVVAGSLRSVDPVGEPHSFVVRARARLAGRESSWRYESFENRIVVPAAIAARSGLVIATARSTTIERELELYGRIGPDEDRLAHVEARFPGIVRELAKRIGDRVRHGETLAVIESNESLRPFTVTSPLDGVVVAKAATVGETTGDGPLYVVADLGSVWLDLAVPGSEVSSLAVGQPLRVRVGKREIAGRVDFLSPLGMPATQSMLARSFLANPEGDLRPGLFAVAHARIETAEVPVAVRPEALQRLGPWTVVFRNQGEIYEAQPVEVGRRDRAHVEILSGLRAGDAYVADGSFVLKAEAGKSEASHDH